MAMVRKTKDGGSHEVIGDNPLDQIWACLDCYWKGRVGECDIDFSCPKCRGLNVHRAEGEARALDQYFGEIGSKQ